MAYSHERENANFAKAIADLNAGVQFQKAGAIFEPNTNPSAIYRIRNRSTCPALNSAPRSSSFRMVSLSSATLPEWFETADVLGSASRYRVDTFAHLLDLQNPTIPDQADNFFKEPRLTRGCPVGLQGLLAIVLVSHPRTTNLLFVAPR
ncbi:MAG: hypothetical protein ACI9OD_004608 [Limisphaerales bacterium]